MAKRRKSRKLGGLAGSPEHHSERASALVERSMKLLRTSAEASKGGRCNVAYTDLLLGATMSGAAESHMQEAGHQVGGASSMSTLFTRADRAFSDNCTGGKLAGLRRRKKLSGLGAGMSASGTSKGKSIKLSVVKKDDEWQVRVYENGKFKEGPTYYAGDKQDAVDTFKSMKAQYGLAGLRRRRKSSRRK